MGTEDGSEPTGARRGINPDSCHNESDCSLLRGQIEEQALTVDVAVDPPDLTLSADPNLLDKVLVNLALNALQAVEAQDEGHVAFRASEMRAHTLRFRPLRSQK